MTIPENDLNLAKIEKYVKDRNVLLMIENKEIISKAVNLVKKSEGEPVGCVIVSTQGISEEFLQKIRSAVSLPVEAPKHNPS